MKGYGQRRVTGDCPPLLLCGGVLGGFGEKGWVFYEPREVSIDGNENR